MYENVNQLSEFANQLNVLNENVFKCELNFNNQLITSFESKLCRIRGIAKTLSTDSSEAVVESEHSTDEEVVFDDSPTDAIGDQSSDSTEDVVNTSESVAEECEQSMEDHFEDHFEDKEVANVWQSAIESPELVTRLELTNKPLIAVDEPIAGGEEVDRGQVAQDVDDRASSVGVRECMCTAAVSAPNSMLTGVPSESTGRWRRRVQSHARLCMIALPVSTQRAVFVPKLPFFVHFRDFQRSKIGF